ncbi:MAG: hypothetical protein WC824_10515, partial [Bacteroidota bacterium]
GSDRSGQLLKIESAGFQLPTSLEIGLAYNYRLAEFHNLLVMTSFENNNFITDQYRLAAEYVFNDFLALRGSFTIAGNAKTDYEDVTGYLYGPAFGVGLQQWTGDVKLYLDYAYRSREVFGGQHVVALKIGF